MLDSFLRPPPGLRSTASFLLTGTHFDQFASSPAPVQKHEGVAGRDRRDLSKGVRWSRHVTETIILGGKVGSDSLPPCFVRTVRAIFCPGKRRRSRLFH